MFARTLPTVIALLAMLTCGQACAQNAGYRPQLGKRHPALRLPNIEHGEAVSLADYLGKKVLLIHFASW